MSHNTDPNREASRHKPALMAMAVALLTVIVLFLVLRPGWNEDDAGIATTPPPVETLSEPEAQTGGQQPSSSGTVRERMGIG